jgi:hypothetical protein
MPFNRMAFLARCGFPKVQAYFLPKVQAYSLPY